MKTKLINFPDLKKAASKISDATKFYEVKSDSDLTNFGDGQKYFIKTYGCQANIRDEETMRGLLESVGYTRVDKPENSDLIIINTCAVRENAEDKVYGEVGNLKHLRKKNKNLVLAICGCMVEQPEILSKMTETFPEINLFFGTHEIYKLLYLIKEVKESGERLIAVESKAGEVVEGLPVCRNNNSKAFVNIIYGCNKFCTYCIVPYTRGRERSRKFKDIIEECKILVKEGYKEITLLGQNVNAYGKDLLENKDFADLLEEVAKLGIPRLRFTTSHPWDFSSRMIDVIAKYPNIMKCIHLPVQSGSNSILRAMGRRYTREDYLNLVKEMRNKIPGLSLSTDIIVGFPNESDEEFNDTLSLVDEVKYESAFTFIYSPRRGTPAAKIQDNVTYQTKSKRFKELVNHLEVNFEEQSKKMINNVYDVLVDGPSKTNRELMSGYTENNKLVHFKGDETLIGRIVKVKILESHTYSMIGELVNE